MKKNKNRKRPRKSLPRRELGPLVEKAVHDGVRDCESAQVGLSSPIFDETPGMKDAAFSHVRLAPIRQALQVVGVRHRAADNALDTAVLAPMVGALTDAVSRLSNEEEPDSTTLRILIWTALRRYRGLVRRPTWLALITAWNAAQSGREEWQIEREGEDLPRITYDYPVAGLDGPRRPSERGGLNMPVARIRRLVGYEL